MKIIFFAFKHRYRFKDLNNFLHSRKYGQYLIINLSGPFKYYLSKIFMFLKIGKYISCDGKPIIKDHKIGYNFFIRGTDLNIPSDFKSLENNIVSIKHPMLKNKKIFQVYPINLKKVNPNKNLKIVFMSTINVNCTKNELNIWEKHKNEILNNFSIIDNKEFWLKITNERNNIEINKLYRRIKLLLRFEIIKHLKNKYNEKFNLFGDDWNKYYKDALRSDYNIKNNINRYKGNICLDLGCIEGSSSLYSRSNQIIESGGIIVQSEQMDSSEKFDHLKGDIVFNNFIQLDRIFEKILNDYFFAKKILEKINTHFSNSNRNVEKELKKYF
jgi:hypothetical protein